MAIVKVHYEAICEELLKLHLNRDELNVVQ
jgi:hypothetical protein